MVEKTFTGQWVDRCKAMLELQEPTLREIAVQIEVVAYSANGADRLVLQAVAMRLKALAKEQKDALAPF